MIAVKYINVKSKFKDMNVIGNKETVSGLSAFDNLTSKRNAGKLKKIITFRFLKRSDVLMTRKLKCTECKVYAWVCWRSEILKYLTSLLM